MTAEVVLTQSEATALDECEMVIERGIKGSQDRPDPGTTDEYTVIVSL